MNASRTDWFVHDRFGMFVHFGLYSVAARHEWVQNYERIEAADYARYARFFDPDLFDARTLARQAREAGARYVVLTAKHHEGFCLWDTATTPFNAVEACGRDLVREYVDALRAEGLRVGLYFSLLDWSHPQYTIDRHHPQRGVADVAERNAARDMAVYREYLHAQVRELLTGYGPLDYLFFDFTEPAEEDGLPGKSPEDWDAETLLAMCRELQPDMVVNDRLASPPISSPPSSISRFARSSATASPSSGRPARPSTAAGATTATTTTARARPCWCACSRARWPWAATCC